MRELYNFSVTVKTNDLINLLCVATRHKDELTKEEMESFLNIEARCRFTVMFTEEDFKRLLEKKVSDV